MAAASASGTSPFDGGALGSLKNLLQVPVQDPVSGAGRPQRRKAAWRRWPFLKLPIWIPQRPRSKATQFIRQVDSRADYLLFRHLLRIGGARKCSCWAEGAPGPDLSPGSACPGPADTQEESPQGDYIKHWAPLLGLPLPPGVSLGKGCMQGACPRPQARARVGRRGRKSLWGPGPDQGVPTP